MADEPTDDSVLPQENGGERQTIADDVRTLHHLGYEQELLRGMGGFSNFAISFSVICILAGGITSFPQGFSAVGGAAAGLVWPLGCLMALCVALTMAQVASAFPTAGGVYHWASILGGRGLGWATAWFNLAGLVTVLAAINLGLYDFFLGAFDLDPGPNARLWLVVGVVGITASQALFNHKGIRITSLLTDFSGYVILAVATLLTVAMLVQAESFDFGRLTAFTNFSGEPGGGVLPANDSLPWLFMLALLLPAYTVTGFDASANTSEETVGASRTVPAGIVRSVLVSGVFGWMMLCAVVLAIPSLDAAAAQGGKAFPWTMKQVLPLGLAQGLLVGIVVAQYLCGLATLTSASRMMYAFARDGGTPCSGLVRSVSRASQAPYVAIWTVTVLSVLFMVLVPYATIAAICAMLLYVSYVLPTTAGFFAYGRTWTAMGPWSIGRWYKPLALVAALWCGLLVYIGMQPPNDLSLPIVGGLSGALAVAWFTLERKRFGGPPMAPYFAALRRGSVNE
jgi:amino acid transporter